MVCVEVLVNEVCICLESWWVSMLLLQEKSKMGMEDLGHATGLLQLEAKTVCSILTTRFELRTIRVGLEETSLNSRKVDLSMHFGSSRRRGSSSTALLLLNK